MPVQIPEDDPKKKISRKIMVAFALGLVFSSIAELIILLSDTHSPIARALLAASKFFIFTSLFAYIFRSSLRVHLSTAIMLTISAGLLVGQNVTVRMIDDSKETLVRGWPIPFYVEQGSEEPPRWIIGSVYLDAGIGLLLLVLVGYLFERFVVRRKTIAKANG